MGHLSDQELIEAINQSDYAAFTQLYEQYWEKLLKIAIKKTGGADNAMDAVQDLFVDIWHKRSSLSVRKSVEVYLVSSLYFKIFMQFRERGLAKRHIDNYARFLEQSTDDVHYAEADYEVQYEQLIDRISEVVDAMPERMKVVFELKYSKALTNQEISDVLGISIQTVKNQLSKALDLLRKSTRTHQMDAMFMLFIAWALQAV